MRQETMLTFIELLIRVVVIVGVARAHHQGYPTPAYCLLAV